MKKKGTSLVELLAVIVIMGVIAAIAVPTVGALIKNTKKKACNKNIQALVTSCAYVLEFGDTSYTGHEAEIDDVFIESGLTKTGEFTFKGQCPSGGSYYYRIDVEGNLEIGCNHVDHSENHVFTSPDEAFDMILEAANYTKIDEILKRPGSGALDSNASDGEYNKKLLEYIKSKGFEVDNKDYTYQFQFNKSTRNFEFFYATEPLEGNVGKRINARKLIRDENGNQVANIPGTIMVKEHRGYLIIDGATFQRS